MMTRSNLALAVVFTGLILFSTVSPIAAATATSPSSVRTEAVTPIQKFTLTEWSAPTAASGPYGVGVDTNGKVWFTENDTNKIARFDPTNNNFTEWIITTPKSDPHNVFVKLVTSSNGSVTRIFFTEFASSKIAQFDTSTNKLTEWALAANSNPAGIYVDENNVVWFAESGRDIIGRLIPSTGQLTEWTLPGASTAPGSPALKPWSVYVQVVTNPLYSNRFVWFTEMLGDKIGRLEVTSNRLTVWDFGALGFGVYQPSDLTLGTFQTLPVTIITSANNRVSVLGNDTGGGSLYQEAILPSFTAGPMGITYDSRRNAAWFSENNIGNIANLNTTNVLAGRLFTPTYCTIAPLTGSPNCSSPATMLSSNITSTVSSPVGISQLVSPVATSTVGIHQGPVAGVTEYSLSNSTSRPTYVSVDSMGNVWFTENNVTVNRIGRLSVPYVFQMSASPSTQTINPGQTATFSLSINLTSGYPQPAQLSLLNVPSGVAAVFSPQSQNPPFSSTLTLTTTNSTTIGSFPMTVQAVSGGETAIASITLIIEAVKPPPPPTFDFDISVVAPTTETVNQGESASFSLLVGLVSGSPQPVTLTASGFPTGVTYSFTRPSGNPTFNSTINIFTSANAPGGTYPITITGSTSGLTHNAEQTPVLTIIELPRDFNLSTTVTHVTLVQSSRVDMLLTVTSVGYFNGNVSLSGSFSPSSGLTVTFTPSTVLLQSGGAVTQSTMEITAPKNTVGNYQLTVTGSSSTPSRAHQLTISIQVSPCLIATATYGSELAPQVQFLRDFRDQQIMNTFAGSNFMTVFNAWYYSFSPGVAQYESRSPEARSIAKVALYPLMQILRLSEATFLAFGPVSETGALAAGLLAGALIGLTYLALPLFCILWPLRRRISARAKARVIRTTICVLALFLLGFAMSEVFVFSVLMMVSSAGLVLAALILGSLFPAVIAAEFRRTV
ncbi:MAG TPA: CFI-box-CTERM domain-containing protein [Candidatus Dormibacteraeota bacterium]|nr:CFI-box-CTERM domain-containing protein [Candidatus Dormibacteraeota bacterium]